MSLNLSLRQLRVFEAVARQSSYTRAAEQLFMTQPAVSMQVRQMEETLGVELFERAGKAVQLTEAGRELFQYTRGIFQDLEELEQVMEAIKGVEKGRLTVSVASTINYFAPRVLAAFQRLHPGITLKLEVSNRQGLMRQLETNETDLVLMGQPPDLLDLEAHPFMRNPLVVIAPPDHPLAGERNIPVPRLAQELFVMREKGSGTRLAMERFFEERKLPIRMGMEMTRAEAIKQAVRAGLGLGIASRHTLELELETRRLVMLDVEGFPLERRWYVVYRKTKRLSPAGRAFHDFLVQDALAACHSTEWAVEG